MKILQCPRCELRFSAEGDLKDHLSRDHGVEPETLEHHPAGYAPDYRDAPDLLHPKREDSRISRIQHKQS